MSVACWFVRPDDALWHVGLPQRAGFSNRLFLAPIRPGCFHKVALADRGRRSSFASRRIRQGAMRSVERLLFSLLISESLRGHKGFGGCSASDGTSTGDGQPAYPRCLLNWRGRAEASEGMRCCSRRPTSSMGGFGAPRRAPWRPMVAGRQPRNGRLDCCRRLLGVKNRSAGDIVDAAPPSLLVVRAVAVGRSAMTWTLGLF